MSSWNFCNIFACFGTSGKTDSIHISDDFLCLSLFWKDILKLILIPSCFSKKFLYCQPCKRRAICGPENDGVSECDVGDTWFEREPEGEVERGDYEDGSDRLETNVGVVRLGFHSVLRRYFLVVFGVVTAVPSCFFYLGKRLRNWLSGFCGHDLGVFLCVLVY